MVTRRVRLLATAGSLLCAGFLAPAVADAAVQDDGGLYPAVAYDTPVVAALSASGAMTPNAAIGVFHTNLLGVSIFTQLSPTTIRLQGSYSRLIGGAPYFSVIYGNTTCDPAQAFVIGPFVADRHGRAKVDITMAGTNIVAGTGSISVRHGDDATDQDQDGKTGPTDVVAVPGQPSIGLDECDNAPLIRTGATVDPPTGDRNLDGR